MRMYAFIITFQYSLGKHAQATGSLRKITARNVGSGLIANTELRRHEVRSTLSKEKAIENHTLKPVGHQSTNWIVFLVLMDATAA